ncbi:TolC family protein [Flavobacterium agrisoli]|uniref:TolC family protein n=1 Tax=Flavobacterium agrisoli TaxID=2793066 RepID=A0A934PL56_9FLAO|nr:TolC family protein [Flavobacterium agrisoli]MBK0369310.1 TolC family protein [Flavobacterium agrisoli]
MKRFVIPFVVLFSYVSHAQNSVLDTLRLKRNDAEILLLQNNLGLLAEKLNIDIAQAQIIQAKVWPNPTLSVNEFNLWSNATSEQLPVLWGNYGRNQEFGASIEQLLYTAGKRKKMIAIEKVGAAMAEEYYKNVLRNLKTEFRNNLSLLQFNQSKKAIYQNQLEAVSNLIRAYSKQMQLGTISQAEFIRLKATELSFLNEISTIEIDQNALQNEMRKLLQLPAYTYIEIVGNGLVPDLESIKKFDLQKSVEQLVQNRPDVQLASLNTQYHSKKLDYEKALRTPDVTVEASYDRGGNIMNNFVGFGFSIDLPFFDRNKGNISAAKWAVDQSKLNNEAQINSAKSEIIMAYQNFEIVKKRYENVDENYEENLDQILASYYTNFQKRNISLLIYLDFVEAYLNNKTILLETKKELNDRLEMLKNVSGQELN